MFKSIRRYEFTSTNGATLRIDYGPDGDVKFASVKNKRFQSSAVVNADAFAQCADQVAALLFSSGGESCEDGVVAVARSERRVTIRAVDGCIRVAVMRGSHYESINILTAEDSAKLIDILTGVDQS